LPARSDHDRDRDDEPDGPDFLWSRTARGSTRLRSSGIDSTIAKVAAAGAWEAEPILSRATTSDSGDLTPGVRSSRSAGVPRSGPNRSGAAMR
jgi:hypothetical protein